MEQIQNEPSENNNECCVHPDSAGLAKANMLRDEILYDLADFYKVFGDSTRLKILCALLNGELCVGDLAETLSLNQSAVSHQLRVLRQNDLVKFRKDGKTSFYSLDDEHVSTMIKEGIEHIMHNKIYE